MKSQIVYKVVWNRCNELVSANQSDNFPTSFRTIYKLNDITCPNVPGTKLFCFDSLKNAKNFIDHYVWRDKSGLKIYEAEAYNVYKPKATYIVNICNMIFFWKLIKRRKKKYRQQIQSLQNDNVITPDGSLVCSSLKLLKEIL